MAKRSACFGLLLALRNLPQICGKLAPRKLFNGRTVLDDARTQGKPRKLRIFGRATTGCHFKTQICILKLTSGETAEIPFWPGRGRHFWAKADIESQAGPASSVALSLACDRYFVGVVVLDR